MAPLHFTALQARSLIPPVLLLAACFSTVVPALAQPDPLGRHYTDGFIYVTPWWDGANVSQPAVFDINNDGKDDVGFSLVGEPFYAPAQLYILCSNEQGTLDDCTEELVVGEIPIIGQGYNQILPADFNKDGWLDLFLEGTGPEPPCEGGGVSCFPGGQSSLLLSDANGKLVNVTSTNLPAFTDYSHGSVLLDYDSDGDMDVYVNNLAGSDLYDPWYPYLLENDGSGSFSVAANLIADPETNPPGRNGIFPEEELYQGFTAMSADANGDGHDDLIFGITGIYSDQNPEIPGLFRTIVLLNDRAGHFETVPGDAYPMPPDSDPATLRYDHSAVADINNDGLDDLLPALVSDTSPRHMQVLISNGDGTFRDETAARFPASYDGISDFQLHDLDGDGHLDVFSTAARGNDTYTDIRINDGEGYFRPLVRNWIIPTKAIVLDVDGDGGTDALLDLVLYKMSLPYGAKLDGTSDVDYLIGGALDNVFRGFAGNDVLDGGLGSDYLDGGAGSDTLRGGKGDDQYVFRSTDLSDHDTIQDKLGIDTLRFEDFGLAEIASAERSNGDLVLHHAPGGSITIVDHFEPTGNRVEFLWTEGEIHPIPNDTAFVTGTIQDLIQGNALPAAPILVLPARDAALASLTAVLSWYDVDDGSTSTVQIATDEEFLDVVQESEGLEDPDFVATGLSPNTVYYWRVRYVGSMGPGPWSAVRRFVSGNHPMPLIVEPLTPSDEADDVSPITVLSWRSAQAAEFYHLQLDTAPTFSNPIVDDSTLTSTTDTLKAPLSYGIMYSWRVRGGFEIQPGNEDCCGPARVIYGPWSDTQSFTVAVGTATEDGLVLPRKFALGQNYPNPFNSLTTIGYDLPEPAHVRIQVFDYLGREIAHVVDRNLPAGSFNVRFEAVGLSSGIYFYRLNAGETVKTKRMLVVR